MVDNQNNFERRNAAPVASGKQFNEEKMRITTVEALKNEGKQIVFLGFNRDVTDETPHVRKLAKSIKEEGLLTPLHLIPAITALAEEIELLNENGSSVTDGTDKYALVDGNNKYRAIQVLRATKEPGMAGLPITCIIDEDAKDIKKMVMTMNNVVKPWSNADAVKAANKIRSNAVVDFIAEKVKDGFSLSTLSLLLTGQNNKITKSVLMKYAANMGDLPKCDLVSAKKKLEAMKEAGFSNKFCKSRYLTEAINGMQFQGHNLNDVLEAMKTYAPDEVKFAEDRRDLSLLEDKVKQLEEAKKN